MEYTYLILFLIGSIWAISRRIIFERTKSEKSKEYISLYREHSNLLIIIFLALTIDRLITTFNLLQ